MSTAFALPREPGVPQETIDVCICTFERLSVLRTLDSLARQRLPHGLRIRAIVADNNAVAISRDAVLAHAEAIELQLHYVHAPAANISLARNRCLEEARSDWVAFLDDDEVAPPRWLASLLDARTGKDVVFGPVRAIYPDPETPSWLISGDFHSTAWVPPTRQTKATLATFSSVAA